jgi:sugar phosphate isomerase/epimerase
MPELAVAGSTLALARPGAVAGGGDPAAWAGELAQIAELGFGHVDLVSAWVSPGELDDTALDRLGEALATAGLEPTGVSLVRASMIDPDDGDANFELSQATLEATARLGAPLLSVGFHRPLRGAQLEGPFWMSPAPLDDPGDANFAKATDRLAALSARAAELGLELALELHEGTLLDRGERIRRILETVGAPNLGVNLDLGNLVRVPGRLVESWQETLAACAADVSYTHLKNYIRMEDPARGPAVSAPCGVADGEIDYRAVVSTLVAAGYRGPLCIEHYGGDPFWVMEKAREYLEQLPAVRGARR